MRHDDLGNAVTTAADALRGLLVLLLAAVCCIAPPCHAAGTVVIGMQLEPPVLDPTANPAAAISQTLYGNVYEGLVRFGADGSIEPQLAASWEVSPDGRVIVFHLRPDVRFHDGSVFDAAAATFSLDRARGPDSVNPQRSRLAAIAAIRSIDPLTLELRLSRRSGGLLESLALGSFVMVSPQSAADNKTHPVGTGPFEFGEWRRGDALTLRRNPDYWGRQVPGDAALLDNATFKFIVDPSAAYAALMAGDVDAFDFYPAPESFAQLAADPRFKTSVGSTEGETILALNNRRPPLDDLRVRRAIAHAIDRKALIEGAMFGYGTPIGSHFPPRNPAYIDLTGRYPFDPAEARRLLASAGYPQGLTLSLKLPPPAYARRSGEILAAQLAAVGIRVTLENLEWAQWLDQVYSRHDFDMSIVVHAEPIDYDIYARDDYYFGYSSASFQSLIAALDDSFDPAVRRELLQSIQRKLADDAVNGYLFQYPRLSVWNARFRGLGFDNVLGVVELKEGRCVSVAGVAGICQSVRGSAANASARARAVGRAALWIATAGMLWVLAAAMRRLGAPYLGRRIGILLATTLAATVIVFLIVEVAPGDPVRFMMGLQADPAAVSAMRRELGLDDPPLARYVTWVAGLIHGDFGVSYTYRIPVARLIAERLRVSVPLALYALALAVAMALPAGLAAAARRGRAADWLVNGVTQLGLAVPNFWLGLLLVMLFAVHWHWVAAGGFPGWDAGVLPALRALTLPALALAMPQAAILTRVLRGALFATLDQDYVRSARAKGASEWRVVWRHALPNALVPVVTILGMQFSFLLAGAVIIENVFFLPGLGRLVFQAIAQRDLIVVQSVVVLLVIAVVSVNFVVEVVYGLVDPRLEARADP